MFGVWQRPHVVHGGEEGGQVHAGRLLAAAPHAAGFTPGIAGSHLQVIFCKIAGACTISALKVAMEGNTKDRSFCLGHSDTSIRLNYLLKSK